MRFIISIKNEVHYLRKECEVHCLHFVSPTILLIKASDLNNEIILQ